MADNTHEYNLLSKNVYEILTVDHRKVKANKNKLKELVRPEVYQVLKQQLKKEYRPIWTDDLLFQKFEKLIGYGDNRFSYEEYKQKLKDFVEQDIVNADVQIDRITEYLKTITELYEKKKKCENKILNAPKESKKTREYKALVREKNELINQLRKFCGSSSPFTEKGKQIQQNTSQRLAATIETFPTLSDRSIFIRGKTCGVWYSHYSSFFPIEDYVRGVYKGTFTKIINESLQDHPLVRCINNDDPKWVPMYPILTKRVFLYQKFYNHFLATEHSLLSIEEARSKLQEAIVGELCTYGIIRSDSMSAPERFTITHTLYHHSDYYDNSYENKCLTAITKKLEEIKAPYTQKRYQTIEFLQVKNHELKQLKHELKQKLKKEAYKKFKEIYKPKWSNKDFVRVISEAEKMPHCEMDEFSNNLDRIIKRNDESLKLVNEQVNNYLERMIPLYTRKKELEQRIVNFSPSIESGQMTVEQKKMILEKKELEETLKKNYGTSGPFTEKGKHMIDRMVFENHEQPNNQQQPLRRFETIASTSTPLTQRTNRERNVNGTVERKNSATQLTRL